MLRDKTWIFDLDLRLKNGFRAPENCQNFAINTNCRLTDSRLDGACHLTNKPQIINKNY